MSRTPSSPDGFSREESRYLDGELPADAQRRMEHRLAADPDGPDRVAAYRDAMDLWREDAARTAGRINDAGGSSGLEDRVLASIADEPPRLALSRAAPWYAAAAMVLIGVGLAGTLFGLPEATATPPAHETGLVDIEQAMMDLLIDGPEFLPPLASSGGPK